MSYISPSDIYAEGVDTSDFPPGIVQSRIDLWQAFIDRATGQFFESRSLEFFIDGTGSANLWFQVPIISLTELYINDDFDNAVDLDNVVVYNGADPTRDDRKNPRIALKGESSESFYARPRYPSEIFVRGHLNQKVKGTFGYLENSATPEEIKFALKKLVIQNLGELGDPGSGVGVDPLAGLKKKEITDGHAIEYASLFGPGGAAKKLDYMDAVGDPVVNAIIKMFKAPRKVAMVYSTPIDPEM